MNPKKRALWVKVMAIILVVALLSSFVTFLYLIIFAGLGTPVTTPETYVYQIGN